MNFQTNSNNGNDFQRKRSKQRDRQPQHVPSFLTKLYEIVNDRSDLKHIVCWSADGLSFVIKDHQQFSETVLAQYFKHSNFASFIRQLNMYDFHKSKRKDVPYQYFQHIFFQKDQKQILHQIKRKSNSNHPLKCPQLQNQIYQLYASQLCQNRPEDGAQASSTNGGVSVENYDNAGPSASSRPISSVIQYAGTNTQIQNQSLYQNNKMLLQTNT